MLCLLPAPAIFKFFTGWLIISGLFLLVFDVIPQGVSANKGRRGLTRADTVFGHVIPFGIKCATMVINFALALNAGRVLRLRAVALVIFIKFMTLSSAPAAIVRDQACSAGMVEADARCAVETVALVGGRSRFLRYRAVPVTAVDPVFLCHIRPSQRLDTHHYR